MSIAQEYRYLYKYYCKKYNERKAHEILADKPVKFLSRANEILKWKDSFDKGVFYEIKKVDNPSTNFNHWNITRLAEQSQAKLGSGFGWGLLWGLIISVLFTIAWLVVCFLFKINYEFNYMAYVAPILLGTSFFAGTLLEIYNFIARMCFVKRQKEFPYASLYIQHCNQRVKLSHILYIPKIDLELLDIYYQAISQALQQKITSDKELLYNKLDELRQSADYHNVVCKSIPYYNYYGKRLPNIKKLMPFSDIRENFDEPKGFKVLMALLDTNANNTSLNCKYVDGYFDSAFFKAKPKKKYRTYQELIMIITALAATALSFFCFKFPFVWHQQKPIAEERFFQDSMTRYNQTCALIDSNYEKKLQQPAYLIGVSVKHKMLRNGGIGNEWQTYAEVDGRKLKRSEITIPVVVGDTLNLYSQITEIDPSSDDVGYDYENIPLTLEQIEDGLSTTLNVNVRESYGPGAGQSADWESNFRVRKIQKLKHPPKSYKPVKEPYPTKPTEKIKQNVSSNEVLKLTLKNLF